MPWMLKNAKVIRPLAVTAVLAGSLAVGGVAAQGAGSVSAAATRPDPGRPIGERLNAGIDAFYESLSRIDAKALKDTATQLGLDGMTLRMTRTLPAANGEVNVEKPMSLMDAWQAARQNDPTLRAARASLNAAQERLPQARSQMLPQVQLSATRFNNELQRDSQNTLGQSLSVFDRYTSGNETLSVRQPLLRPQQVLGVRIAQSGLNEAQAILEQEQQAFSVRLVTAYFETLMAQENERLVLAQRRFLESSLEAAKRSLVAGVGTRTDVDAATVRLDLNTAQTLEARQALASARRQLQAYINRPIGELAHLDEQRLTLLQPTGSDLDDWIRRAEEGSPELRRLRAQRETLGIELNKAKAGHLPTLDLVAQSQRSRSENSLSPQARFLNTQVGLQLNVPLYSGGYVNSLSRQLGAEIERVDELQEAVRLEVGVRTHKEYRAVTEGLLRVQALEQAVRSADVALDSARKSMVAGVRTSLDVLNADQQRVQASRDLAQARYGVIGALMRLYAVAGAGDESLISTLNQLLKP